MTRTNLMLQGRGRPNTKSTQAYSEYIEKQVLILKEIQTLSCLSNSAIHRKLMFGELYAKDDRKDDPESARRWSRWVEGKNRCNEHSLSKCIEKARVYGWSNEVVDKNYAYLLKKMAAFNRLKDINRQFTKTRANVFSALAEFRSLCENVHDHFSASGPGNLSPFWFLLNEDDPDEFCWTPLDGNTLESLFQSVEKATFEFDKLDLDFIEPYIENPTGKRPRVSLIKS